MSIVGGFIGLVVWFAGFVLTWPLVRGRGVGWRFLIYLVVFFGPIGVIVWLLARLGMVAGLRNADRDAKRRSSEAPGH